MSKKWKMPKWMEPYRDLIENTGGNSVEDMMTRKLDPRTNEVVFVLATAVRSQVGLLYLLHERDFLP